MKTLIVTSNSSLKVKKISVSRFRSRHAIEKVVSYGIYGTDNKVINKWLRVFSKKNILLCSDTRALARS